MVSAFAMFRASAVIFRIRPSGSVEAPNSTTIPPASGATREIPVSLPPRRTLSVSPARFGPPSRSKLAEGSVTACAISPAGKIVRFAAAPCGSEYATDGSSASGKLPSSFRPASWAASVGRLEPGAMGLIPFRIASRQGFSGCGSRSLRTAGGGGDDGAATGAGSGGSIGADRVSFSMGSDTLSGVGMKLPTSIAARSIASSFESSSGS